MQNNSFLFPQANLLASNALLFNSFDSLNLLNSISQKRILEPSYADIYEDLQPVKRHLKADYSFNTIKKVEQAPILIDDEENDVVFPQSVSFANNAGIENLLQLTLLNTYLEQIQQAKEVQNRYNELMSNLVKDLVPLEKKDSEIATNYSETESISKQNSPIEAKKAPVFIDLDSEDEEDIVVNSKAVEARAILQVKEASPSNGQYDISSDLLADIPALQKKESNTTGKRVLKMVWTPEDKKTKDVEKLMKKLEEELGIKISNQERVCKLYKENGFSVKKTVEAVMEDRSKYRFELKDKRSVVSQRTKKFNL